MQGKKNVILNPYYSNRFFSFLAKFVIQFSLVQSLSFSRLSLSMAGEFERGSLRSGARFAARNRPFYSSIKDLLQHHPKLLDSKPAVSTEVLKIGSTRTVGNLLQTTIRFRADHPTIGHSLREIFLDLFREHIENETDGFEVVTVFNAILTDASRTSFSVFYGHDYAEGNVSGAAAQLSYSAEPVVVRSVLDVKNIPSSFDLEQIVSERRLAFQQSGVTIDRILNIVYLVRRFVEPETKSKREKKIRLKKKKVGKHDGVTEVSGQTLPPRTHEGQKTFPV